MNGRLKLSEFDISEETGFVPVAPPLQALPEVFSRWEALVSRLSSLISQGRIRQEVRMPSSSDLVPSGQETGERCA